MSTIQDLSYNLAAVRQAQHELNQLGERLLVDGDLGSKTAGAIARFQVAHGMSPTGRLDTVTSYLIDLATLTGGGGTLSSGCSGGCSGSGFERQFGFNPTLARPGFGPAEGRRGFSPAEGRRELGMNPTPAQANGRYDFVYDVPVQGPTDEGMRAASCWWAQNRTPQTPSHASPCVDCTGPIPGWTRQNLYFGPRPSSGWYTNAGGGPVAPSGIGGELGEAISFGGHAVRGFGVGQQGQAPQITPPPGNVWGTLTPDQTNWVQDTLGRFNEKQISAGKPCSLPNLMDVSATAGAFTSVACFQQWFNTQSPPTPLRTDGVLDADTLTALRATANMDSATYPNMYPAPAPAPAVAPPASPVTPAPPSPTPTVHHGGLSTGAMVGIGVAGAAVVGGVIYFATRDSGGSRTRRRTNRRRR